MAAVKALQEKEGPTDMSAVVTLLELEEGADQEAIVNAITKLKTPVTESKEFANVSAELKTYKEKVDTLTKDARIAHFTAIAKTWANVSGKPEDLAQKIYKQEQVSKEAATEMVAMYQATNDALKAANVTLPKGTPAEGDGSDVHEFVKLVQGRMAEKHLDEPTAQAQMQKEEPEKFKDYMKTRKIVFNESPRRENED